MLVQKTIRYLTAITLTFPGLLAAMTPHDINGDMTSDIVWRNQSSGKNYAYQMSQLKLQTGHSLQSVATDWQIAAVADFNQDNKADLLWRNKKTGLNYLFLMDGFTHQSILLNQIATDWQVAAVDDFDGDGQADIWWRNSNSGASYIHFVNNGKVSNVKYINTVADQNWQIAGSGDFDNNGAADIIWRNLNTGQNAIYLMQNGAILNAKVINSVPSQDWQIVGIADFNQDQNADLLWRNLSTGLNYLYFLNGTQVINSKALNTVTDTDWQVKGTGDYNQDGQADILWRHRVSGQNAIYHMNQSNITSVQLINTIADADWQIVPMLNSLILKKLAHNDPQTQIIAAPGMQAPGFDTGSFYSYLSTPAIGNNGHIAFSGQAGTGNQNAVWTGLPSALKLIIKQDDPIPGLAANILFNSKVRSSATPPPVVTSSGHVAFIASLKGAVTTQNSMAILAYVDDQVKLVLQGGQQAPGFPAGTTILNNNIQFVFSDAGMVISAATNQYDVGLWYWDFNSLQLLASTDLQQNQYPSAIAVPYTDCKIGALGNLAAYNGAQINDQGKIVFYSTHTPTNGQGYSSSCPQYALQQWQNNQFGIVVDSAQPVPNLDTETMNLNVLSFTPVALAQNGDVGFNSMVKLTTSTWLKPANQTPKLVMAFGEYLADAPGIGLQTSAFAINANQQTSLLAINNQAVKQVLLRGMPHNDQPYSDFSQLGTTALNKVTEIGMQPPQMAATAYFKLLGRFSLNDSDDLVFNATLSDALTNASQATIWHSNSQNQLQQLVYTGMPLQSGTTNHTLSAFLFLNDLSSHLISGGRSTQHSNAKQLVFHGALDGSTFLDSVILTTY